MNTNKNSLTLTLETPDGVSSARVSLLEGGRLIELNLLNIDLIDGLETTDYQKTFPSSVLFPFANRIRDGEYTFNNSKYKLHCNEKENHNALHGLVFDKTFVCVRRESSSKHASLTLRHEFDGKSEGFPFPFKIELTYKLMYNCISFTVKVENMGIASFPFTLGWHPYFKTKNLFDSFLDYKSSKQVEFDLQKIPLKTIDFVVKMPLQMKDIRLDDAYFLESNRIKFDTPEFDMEITSSSDVNFLQIYTPKQPNVIAIEPMTGIADSFNNGIGLKILKPQGVYEIEWMVIVYNK